MATIPKTAANFVTSIVSKVSSTDPSMSIVSNLDAAGNALADTFAFTIDEGTVAEENMIGTVSGMTVTSITRGLDPQDGQTRRAALQFEHRRGATVKITDHPALTIAARIINGVDTFPNKLSYASHPAIGGAQDIPDKQYVDGVAIAGSPLASNILLGISYISVPAVNPLIPISLGQNDSRVPTQGENDAQVGDNTDIAVGSGNKFVTQTGLQNGAEKYAVSTGSANAYVVTLSPAPNTLHAGKEIIFNPAFTNTGSATLNVNGLGAKAIYKVGGGVESLLVAGDILNGVLCIVVYDGGEFIMQSPSANIPSNTPTYKNGTATYAGNTTSGAQTIAHGLGIVPKYIRLTARKYYGTTFGGDAIQMSTSDGSYNGTTNSCVYSNIQQSITNNSTYVNVDASNGINISESVDHNGSVGASQKGVITVDATNITITWTKANTPNNNNINILWEAIA